MKKVLLVVGHSFKDKGAYNEKLNLSEYDVCIDVATEVFKREKWDDIDLLLKARNKTYIDLPDEINDCNPDYVIELHLNSITNKGIQGSEHLYFSKSIRGEKMASILQEECVKTFGLKNRGLKAILSNDRGNNILARTRAVCVIAEPFFLSFEELKNETVNVYKQKYTEYLMNAIRKIVDNNI